MQREKPEHMVWFTVRLGLCIHQNTPNEKTTQPQDHMGMSLQNFGFSEHHQQLPKCKHKLTRKLTPGSEKLHDRNVLTFFESQHKN